MEYYVQIECFDKEDLFSSTSWAGDKDELTGSIEKLDVKESTAHIPISPPKKTDNAIISFLVNILALLVSF